MEPTPKPSRLAQSQKTAAEHQVVQQTGQAREFGSVEEMLQFDAAQTPVPETLEPRLQESLRQEPRPRRPWWTRWFGG